MAVAESIKTVNVYLGLGSNLGDKRANLGRAIGLLAPHVMVDRVSSIYETEPVGYRDQPWFLNVACAAWTGLSPHDLLDYVKEIEIRLGRVPSFRNAPRMIDLDILFYGDKTVQSERLTIPHPRIAERAFVLEPMAELAPGLVNPANGQTIAQMLSAVAGTEAVLRRQWGAAQTGTSPSGGAGHRSGAVPGFLSADI